MNKNYVLLGAVAVAAVVLADLGFAFKHQIKTALMGTLPEQTALAPVPAETPSSLSGAVTEKEAIVEVDKTNNGFSPASVTIKRGTIVKFVNKSGGSMSVASNPHPTHTDYPEFDQWKSAARGKDEYDFTFDKVGTWGYHNHAKPSDGGTVVVTE